MKRLAAMVVVPLLVVSACAYAEGWMTPGGLTVVPTLGLCLNGSNQAVPCGSSSTTVSSVDPSWASASTPWSGSGVVGTFAAWAIGGRSACS